MQIDSKNIPMSDKEELEHRIRDLEDFKLRVELGQKWFLCAIALIGGLLTAAYQLKGLIWK